MKSVLGTVARFTLVFGMALLVPVIGGATPGTSAAGQCTAHSGTSTFGIKLTVNNQGTPSVDPSTNLNGTCVQGSDTVSVDTDSLPSGATWSFTFAENVALFQNGCQLGNGSNQSSSCKVVTSPGAFTYEYEVTVNGKSIDPKIIVRGSGMP